MLWFMIRRVGGALLALLGITALLFGLLHLDPINLGRLILGLEAPVAAVNRLDHELGVYRPIPVQYVSWFNTVILHEQFWSLIAAPSTRSIELVVFADAFAVALAMGAAVLGARYRGSVIDGAVNFIAYLFNAVPGFWLANALFVFFCVMLVWLPATGESRYPGIGLWAVHQILPVSILALSVFGGWARQLRAALDEAMGSDYVRTARAVGAGERRVITRHALRNALLPLVTLVGISLPTQLNTLMVVETLFAIPGLGYGFLGTYTSTFGVATEFGLALAMMTVVGNLLADFLYAVVDPRIRYQ